MSRFLISSSRQGMFEGQMKGLGINTQGTFICLNPLGPIKFAHLNYLRCSQRQRLAKYASKRHFIKIRAFVNLICSQL